MLTPPAALHALLFASGRPMEKREITKILGLSASDVNLALKALTQSLSKSGVVVVETETEVELRTAPEASDIVKKVRENEFSRELGKGSLETLAVIAYRTSATRSDIDWVRGVNSSASVRTLLLRGLIEGREDEHDKRRIRYSLTPEALAHLGVARTDALPRYEELKSGTEAALTREEESSPEESA